MDLTKKEFSHSQLSYNLERNIVKCLTLNGKQTERNTRKKISLTYLLIMCIFSLFHFVAFMKLLALISG